MGCYYAEYPSNLKNKGKPVKTNTAIWLHKISVPYMKVPVTVPLAVIGIK
jgi:hypothetical protein